MAVEGDPLLALGLRVRVGDAAGPLVADGGDYFGRRDTLLRGLPSTRAADSSRCGRCRDDHRARARDVRCLWDDRAQGVYKVRRVVQAVSIGRSDE